MKNTTRQSVHRFEDGTMRFDAEVIAAECLVHIHVNASHVTSLLASPENLGDLATGHLRCEYDLHPPAEGHRIRIEANDAEYHIHVEVKGEFVHSPRNSIVTTSCGGCEQDQLSALVDETPAVSSPASVIDVEQLINSLENMRSQQPGFEATGGMHAAGLMLSAKSKLLIREDIGRHNAVDKVMGAWLESKDSSLPVALLLSGRCGWDIVAKAAQMNIPIIASIGAASSLAIRTARSSNMTLVSFAKDGRAVVIGPVEGRIRRNH